MPNNKSSQDQVPRGSSPQVNDPAPQSPSRRPDPINLDEGGNPTPVGDALDLGTSAAPKNTETKDLPPRHNPGTPDAGSGPAGNPEQIAPQ